jgi:hypothetical protein
LHKTIKKIKTGRKCKTATSITQSKQTMFTIPFPAAQPAHYPAPLTHLDSIKDKANIIDAFFSYAQAQQKKETASELNTEADSLTLLI